MIPKMRIYLTSHSLNTYFSVLNTERNLFLPDFSRRHMTISPDHDISGFGFMELNGSRIDFGFLKVNNALIALTECNIGHSVLWF